MSKVGSLLRRGMLAPIKAVLPKNPWLRVVVYALPVVLLLALFGPALDVALKLVDLVLRVLEPLLQTTLGRVILVVAVLASGSVILVWLLRSRVREMRAEAALGRHIGATAALVGMNRRACRDQFRRVAAYRGPLPARFPHIVQDAHLKLARLALADGDVDGALGSLARVVEPGLPKELERSLLQLRLEALRRQGEVLPATLRREAEAALKRFGADVAVLAVLRDVAAAEGDLDAAVDRQEQIAGSAPPAARVAEQQRFIDMLVAAGRRVLDAGDPERARRYAKRLHRADPEGATSKILLGDVHAALGEHRRAVQEYGAARSPQGLDRIAELTAAHPGVLDPRELVACCPMQGVLLVVARELARAGEHDRAERAARLAADALGPTPTVCAVLAEVLELLGDGRRAQLLREQTVAALLSPAGS